MLICFPTEGQMRRLVLILSLCDKYEAFTQWLPVNSWNLSGRLDASPGNSLAHNPP